MESMQIEKMKSYHDYSPKNNYEEIIELQNKLADFALQ
jgi:hypothetical protein